MEIKDLLPIGSIVILRGSVKKLMIFGIRQIDEASDDKEYDYAGVPYPEGNVGSDNHFLFDHSDIESVVFRGYENEERTEFIKILEDYYKQVDRRSLWTRLKALSKKS